MSNHRHEYALAHPVRTDADLRVGHKARVRYRFETELTVQLSGAPVFWRVRVRFLDQASRPLRLDRWRAGADADAEAIAHTLLGAIGMGTVFRRREDLALVYERALTDGERARVTKAAVA